MHRAGRSCIQARTRSQLILRPPWLPSVSRSPVPPLSSKTGRPRPRPSRNKPHPCCPLPRFLQGTSGSAATSRTAADRASLRMRLTTMPATRRNCALRRARPPTTLLVELNTVHNVGAPMQYHHKLLLAHSAIWHVQGMRTSRAVVPGERMLCSTLGRTRV